jgi:hypothetical protein
MSARAKALLTIASPALAMPVAAQAPGPPTTAFDGKYEGVSAHVSKSGSRHGQCPREHTPEALTIANGSVHSSARDKWAGMVEPQRGVVIRNRRSMQVNAQIDPQGTITGEYHGPECIVTYVWRKRPM